MIFIRLKNIRQYLFTIVILTLAATNIGYSMSIATQKITYTFKLSSKTVSVSESNDYSKDYPRPDQTIQNLNIFDSDIYNDTDRTRVLHHSYWDYGKTFFFRKVKGTLSFTLVLFRTFDNQINLEQSDQFSKTIQQEFKAKYTKTELEEYGVTPPDNFVFEVINGEKWLYYKYESSGQMRFCYSIPISEKHYLMANFRFIDNSVGQKSDWKEQATSTIIQIMLSFHIK